MKKRDAVVEYISNRFSGRWKTWSSGSAWPSTTPVTALPARSAGSGEREMNRTASSRQEIIAQFVELN